MKAKINSKGGLEISAENDIPLEKKVEEFREYMIENIKKTEYLSKEHIVGLKIFDYFNGLFGEDAK